MEYSCHHSPLAYVLGMTLNCSLNCIHIFIVTGSFLYWCVMRPASQRFFIRSCMYLRILIISYLATFLGTNSLSVLMCRRAVNQSIATCFLFLTWTFHSYFESQLSNVMSRISCLLLGVVNICKTSALQASFGTPDWWPVRLVPLPIFN